MIRLQLGVSRRRGGTPGCGQEEEVKFLLKGRRAGVGGRTAGGDGGAGVMAGQFGRHTHTPTLRLSCEHICCLVRSVFVFA